MSILNPIKTATTLTVLFCFSIFFSACDKKDGAEESGHKESTHKENDHKEDDHKEDDHKENAHEESDHKENDHKEHAHEKEAAVPKLKLDGDKKWKANIETTQGVTKLSSIAEAGMKMEKPSPEEIKKKTQELQTTFQNIFKECTMKGASHDQLHYFLVPVDGMIKKISSSDGATASANFKVLHEHLTIYPTYFE